MKRNRWREEGEREQTEKIICRMQYDQSDLNGSLVYQSEKLNLEQRLMLTLRNQKICRRIPRKKEMNVL